MKILDTFSGVWWFHLALQQSIWKENVECIWFCEIDKYAKQVYQEHFPESPDLWDITKLDIDNLENFDLLTWWFPCQDVSVAWKQDLDGGRTVLVEYLLQILEKKKPKYFIFENVKGLMSKKFDKFRESIFDRIFMAWYRFQYKVLNTKDFWLPQNRERVFIVWELEDLTKEIDYFQKEFTFPQWQELTVLLKDMLEEEVDEKYYLSEKQVEWVLNCKFNVSKGIDDINWVSRTLRAAMWMWGWTVPCIKQLNNPTHSNNRVYWTEWISPTLNTMQWWHRQPKIITNINPSWKGMNGNIYRSDTESPTLTTNKGEGIKIMTEEFKIRKLTPTECARLQWFPDTWSTEFVSNSQAYKQMWNAVSVPVVKAIFDKLLS